MRPDARLVRAALAAGAALLLLLALAPVLLAPVAAHGLRAAARARGLSLHWTRLAVALPGRVRVQGLAATRDGADTVLAARELAIEVAPRGLLLRPRLTRVELEQATLRLGGGEADEPDTLAPDEPPGGAAPVAPRVRADAAALARALLLPARALPELRLTDVTVVRGDSTAAALDGLSLHHARGGIELAAAGTLGASVPVPFDALLLWGRDDRLRGRAELREPEAPPLVMSVDGRVSQDRRAGVLRVEPGTQVRVGELGMRVSAECRRRGPDFAIALALDSLTAGRVQRSLPAALLGPLADLDVRGSWGWRARAELDLSQPDSARFTADVLPHGLVLAPGDRLGLLALAGPFTARVHLPGGRIEERALSDANPHYRPLDRIPAILRSAVLTNEDGSFYWHRGFNPEAIQLAVAADLRAGAYRRGAGTVTMQLARNLFLGHQRTLARKGQEVVLAWILEHLAGLSKDRLLEIYLNVIEWGPDVLGADEAARYYFDEDVAQLTLPEALFLTILVPSPGHWWTRLDAGGALRPFARAQMHFIGAKMAAKGWLDPAALPSADSLRIELRGPARARFQPAAADSAAQVPA